MRKRERDAQREIERERRGGGNCRNKDIVIGWLVARRRFIKSPVGGEIWSAQRNAVKRKSTNKPVYDNLTGLRTVTSPSCLPLTHLYLLTSPIPRCERRTLRLSTEKWPRTSRISSPRAYRRVCARCVQSRGIFVVR